MLSKSVKALLDAIVDEELRDFAFDWELWSRDEQKLPKGD